VTGIFSIVFVLYAAVPGHYLNSVLLSSAETFSPFAMSVLSEVANLGPSGGGTYDIWGQVISVISAYSTLSFPSGSAALNTAFGSNWTSGHWVCLIYTVCQIY